MYNYTSNGVDIHLTVCVQIVVFFMGQRLITRRAKIVQIFCGTLFTS